jgi:hypothetical protein
MTKDRLPALKAVGVSTEVKNGVDIQKSAAKY